VRGDRRRRAEPACARSFSRVYGDQDQDDSRAWAIRAIRVIRGAKEFQENCKESLDPLLRSQAKKVRSSPGLRGKMKTDRTLKKS